MTNHRPRLPRRTMRMVGQRPSVETIESHTMSKLMASQIQRIVKIRTPKAYSKALPL